MVIRKLHAIGIERSVLGVNIQDIKTTCNGFQTCVFTHVTKQANTGAHLLATEGLKKEEDIYLFNVVPPHVQEAVNQDCSHLNSLGGSNEGFAD